MSHDLLRTAPETIGGAARCGVATHGSGGCSSGCGSAHRGALRRLVQTSQAAA